MPTNTYPIEGLILIQDNATKKIVAEYSGDNVVISTQENRAQVQPVRSNSGEFIQPKPAFQPPPQKTLTFDPKPNIELDPYTEYFVTFDTETAKVSVTGKFDRNGIMSAETFIPLPKTEF